MKKDCGQRASLQRQRCCLEKRNEEGMKSIFNIFSIIIATIHNLTILFFSRFKRRTFTYATSNGRKMKGDLYLPFNVNHPLPLIIHLHGGGWITGNRKDVQSGILKQIKRGYAVASISYSFAQHSKWPTQAQELKAAIRYLRANAQDFGIDSSCIFLWGVSAGGHIASVVGAASGTNALEGNLGNADYSSKVQGVVVWYPPTDVSNMEHIGPFNSIFPKSISYLIGAEMQKNRDLVESLNPLQYIHSQTPPFFIMHGTHDRIVHTNQSELLYKTLTQKGIDANYICVEKYLHADYRFNREKHIKDIEAFLDKIAAKHKSE